MNKKNNQLNKMIGLSIMPTNHALGTLMFLGFFKPFGGDK